MWVWFFFQNINKSKWKVIIIINTKDLNVSSECLIEFQFYKFTVYLHQLRNDNISPKIFLLIVKFTSRWEKLNMLY